jgi:hypothetical protein
MSRSDRSDGTEGLGHWGYLLALLLSCLVVGFLSFSQGQETERRNAAPYDHSESAKSYAQRACLGRDGVAQFECIYDAVEASSETARADQDLDAQQGMRFWSVVMVVVSMGTAAITGIGVLYVKRTLDATLVAVESTSDATQAMFEANLIAKESMQVQSRAYIGLDEAKFERRGNHLVFYLTFKNGGQTPARRYKGIGFVHFSAASAMFLPSNPLQADTREGVTIVGAGSAAVITGKTEIPPEEWRILEMGAHRIYAFAFVGYTDVFKIYRETIVTLESNFPLDGTFRPFRNWSNST